MIVGGNLKNHSSRKMSGYIQMWGFPDEIVKKMFGKIK